MAITINERPKGIKLSPTPLTVWNIEEVADVAKLTGGSFTDGLEDGDKVYIKNTFDGYNGFWVLQLIDGSDPDFPEFYLTQNNVPVSFTQEVESIELYVADIEVSWSSVNLPIQYLLQSDLSPNSADSAVSITGFANDNGYVKLTLGTAISAEALDWIEVKFSTEDELDGPFQILTKWSTTQYTINAPYTLAYLSPYTYSVAVAKKYYNNYAILIRIYSGLSGTYATQNPYELITEFRLAPDTDGVVIVNVADATKQKINIRKNRPNLGTMPYDIDRYTGFYIEYAETYDVEGETFTTSYTSDLSNFEGFAIDSALEFKNLYSGYMSAYINNFLSDGSPTLFGEYFDISILRDNQLHITLSQKTYDQYDNLLTENLYDITETNGVIRYPLSIIGDETKQILTLTDKVLIVLPTSWDQQGTTFTETSTSWTKVDTVDFSLVTRMAIEAHSGTTLFAFMFSIAQAFPGSYSGTVTTSSGQILLSFSHSGSGTIVHTTNETVTNSDITYIELSIDFTVGAAQSAVVALTDIPNGVESIGATLAYVFDEDTEKIVAVSRNCYPNYIYLTWKNHLGGFNYWLFTGNKDYNVNVLDTQERSVNIIDQWPNSYGPNADTLTYEASRNSRREMTVRSQNMTREQLEFVSGIRQSSLIQQLTSKYDRRTMIIEKKSFKIRTDGETGPYSIEFVIRETNNIASQTL